MGGEQKLTGPDLAAGIATSELDRTTMLVGHARGEPVLLVRQGAEFFGIGAACSHYSGPLVDGLLVDGTIRCPLHHACFDLRSGEPVRAPALNPIPCYELAIHDGVIRVVGRKPEKSPVARTQSSPRRVVVIGAGAAGQAATETLRREGYTGDLLLIGADPAPPVDRPNLSKDFLAGNAPEEWLPLRPPEFFANQRVDTRFGVRVWSIDVTRKQVVLEGGGVESYDRLLLATGADPIKLDVPGGDLPHVHCLRTLEDCRRIIDATQTARRAVVVGSSFIGLEVAASLRARNLEVQVVSRDTEPLARVLGVELGTSIRELHESHGVVFHLERTPKAIDARFVTLDNGERLSADLVITGVGVRPNVTLAQKAGVAVENGVIVDEYLETNVPGVFAAGDIASWPDPRAHARIRVEHWVVAQRQGQTVARNMLGRREKFTAVPFFWTSQYDLQLNYVGRATSWDRVEIDGSVEARDAAIRFISGGETVALATINRDADSLNFERQIEQTP